jgi:hypothetical protein
MCWAMMRAGESPERVAAKLHMPVEDIESAVREFEAARSLASDDIVSMLVNAEVITAVEGAGNRLQEAQHAMRDTGREDALGRPIMEPDHHLALEAIQTAGELIERVRPKGGGVNVAVGIQNSGNGNGVGQVKTFEQRVREKRGVLDDGDVKFLGDGNRQVLADEIVDGDMDDDDEDEDGTMIDADMDGTSELEIEEADEAGSGS